MFQFRTLVFCLFVTNIIVCSLCQSYSFKKSDDKVKKRIVVLPKVLMSTRTRRGTSPVFEGKISQKQFFIKFVKNTIVVYFDQHLGAAFSIFLFYAQKNLFFTGKNRFSYIVHTPFCIQKCLFTSKNVFFQEQSPQPVSRSKLKKHIFG